MFQHVSVNNRQTFQEFAGGEPALMPVPASIEWGGGRLYDSSPGLLPGGLYRGDTAEARPFLFFADDDDEDDIEDDDDFDDADDDFDDDFDDDDFDDDDEDDDFDEDDEEYDYEEDVDYDEFDE
ncbi:MAG: hypothetical protein LBH15_05845 [Treponema sp.]|jgi:hypothetical protein|nr:hypothetical protein [Treponema sp.]